MLLLTLGTLLVLHYKLEVQMRRGTPHERDHGRRHHGAAVWNVRQTKTRGEGQRQLAAMDQGFKLSSLNTDSRLKR